MQGGSNFESLDVIVKYDHSIERYRAVLCCGVFVMLYKVILVLFL